MIDEDMNEYCCVVVGNKIDTIVDGRGLVSKSDALAFLNVLVPPSSPIAMYPSPSLADQEMDHSFSHVLTSHSSHNSSSTSSSSLTTQVQNRSDSIDIHHPNHISHSLSPSHKLTQSRSRLSPQSYNGTVTTTRTTFTIYHTPSSSLYHSARSSPEPLSLSEPTSPTPSFRQRRLNKRSSGSVSSGSAPTITPSLYAREHGSSSNANISDHLLPTMPQTSPSSSFSPPPLLPPPPERGPKLFFTSAKTGEGVADVFEYITYRVNRKWEYEEQVEARRMDFRESSAAESFRLGLLNNGGVGRDKDGRGRWGHGCCSS